MSTDFIISASPTPETHRVFENLRARWSNNQIHHVHIPLTRLNSSFESVLNWISGKKANDGVHVFKFSSITLSSYDITLVPDTVSANTLQRLATTFVSGIQQSPGMLIYSGPSAAVVYEELSKEGFHTSFTFTCDGVSALLPSLNTVSPTIYGKVLFSEPWIFRSTNYIDGAWKPTHKGNWMPVYNPATGEVIHHVASSTAEDVNDGVLAAKRAFPTWSNEPAASRARYLELIADAIDVKKNYLSSLETLDNGKSLAESIVDVDDVSGCFRYYAKHLLQFEATSAKTLVDVGNTSFNADVTYQPIGVSALIIPWNYPLLMAAWKVAPCLAAGCTCVLKPSELTPLTALELASIIHGVGLPPGVFNLVQGNGPDCGFPLSSHPDVVKIAFTGSVPTGARISAAGSSTIKKVSLELGGKSPLIVCSDADLDQDRNFHEPRPGLQCHITCPGPSFPPRHSREGISSVYEENQDRIRSEGGCEDGSSGVPRTVRKGSGIRSEWSRPGCSIGLWW
eukprot:TRINITY_DN3858_c0_g1_i8.p1 TRINITY_DN3858_c0_g1~~TRINITY_DN3858_c0_g1_i8.p1  ORF type:complete len:510 (-),score=70.54 TRINITY_DN3858_c0_g1_i8:594-2123(-)